MSKKSRKIHQSTPQPTHNNPNQVEKEGIKDWKGTICGGFLVVVGFILLSFANSNGSNWPSFLSPLFIVTGYLVVGFSLTK